MAEKIFGAKSAAKLLAVSEKTIFRWLKSGKIPPSSLIVTEKNKIRRITHVWEKNILEEFRKNLC